MLTHAQLERSGEPMKDRCGACSDCVDGCPVHAFTGRPFHEEEPIDLRFDVHKCERNFEETVEATGVRVCGMCLYICPFGKKASARLEPEA